MGALICPLYLKMYTTKGYSKLTKEEILLRINPIDIFNYYISNFETPLKSFCSELRKDNNPSCRIKIYKNGITIYKDFGNKDTFDCFSYVQAKYNINYLEALKVINNDFNLGLDGVAKSPPSPILIGISEKEYKINEITPINIKRRKWNNKIDKKYWNSYYITCEILNIFDVFPCSHIWIKKYLFKVKYDNPSYAYRIKNNVFKILSPYAKKEFKWISNTTEYDIQGYKQLPENGELLIITKSLKDVMVLYLLGYTAIAPQNEQINIPDNIMKELKIRFKKIILFYDDDPAGNMGRELICSNYNISSVILKGESKDISDYIKNNGKEKTSLLLKNLFK